MIAPAFWRPPGRAVTEPRTCAVGGCAGAMLRARAAREPRPTREARRVAERAPTPTRAAPTTERSAVAERAPDGPDLATPPPRPPIRVAADRTSAGARARGVRPVPGQLRLPFTPLPVLGIEPEWKAQPRLWGHAYHPMCSYLASFPAALAHAFVARYTRPGDVVLDPFSGRGTTPLQACAEGRIGVGNDLNPLAHVLTAAKVEPPAALEARGSTGRPAPRLVVRGRRLARAGGARDRGRPGDRAGCRVRRRSRGPGRSPSPPRSPSPSTRGRWASSSSSAAASGSPSRPTASWPLRSPASSTASARATSRR